MHSKRHKVRRREWKEGRCETVLFQGHLRHGVSTCYKKKKKKNTYKENDLGNTVTLFTFSTLQLHTCTIRAVVGGVTPVAAVGAGAEPAVLWARLTSPVLAVVESLRTHVQTLTFIKVTLHSKLIWK